MVAPGKTANRKPRTAVLAIGSHPDDIEYGCGGTLRRYVNMGCDVHALILTCGEQGGAAEVRRKEQSASAKILGLTKVHWGAFEDTRMPFYERVIPAIEKTVKEVRPHTVFVHHGKDTHQDHRHVSTCTVVAARNVPNVLFFEGPTTYGFEPSVFVDIRDSIKEKFRSLSCHRSQVMKTNVELQSIVDIARATAVFRGTQCRMSYAEAFCSLRMFLLQPAERTPGGRLRPARGRHGSG